MTDKRANVLIGATLTSGDIPYWEPKLQANNWMRVFPNSDGAPPVSTDTRYAYIQRVAGVPFVSSKADGNSTILDNTKQRLISLAGVFSQVYYTDRHEPEGDLTAAQYKANMQAALNMVNSLSLSVRAKVKFGPVLTRQWTENTSGRSYSDHDPGFGDFFGVDMYANSWGSGNTAATSYPDPAVFCNRFKTYRYTPSDARPRCWPELGAVGLPFDTSGSARATWLQGAHDEAASMTGFLGYMWWNANGASGTDLSGIGTSRYFQLDRRHTGNNTYVILNPAMPLDKYNSLVTASGGDYESGYEAGWSAGYDKGVADGRSAAYADMRNYIAGK